VSLGLRGGRRPRRRRGLLAVQRGRAAKHRGRVRRLSTV